MKRVNTANHGYYHMIGDVAIKVFFDEVTGLWEGLEEYKMIDPENYEDVEVGTEGYLYSMEDKVFVYYEVTEVEDID